MVDENARRIVDVVFNRDGVFGHNTHAARLAAQKKSRFSRCATGFYRYAHAVRLFAVLRKRRIAAWLDVDFPLGGGTRIADGTGDAYLSGAQSQPLAPERLVADKCAILYFAYPNFLLGRKMMLRALGGDELSGDKLVRFVYLDESGTGDPGREPWVVVSAVMVHADYQLRLVEKYLSDMADDYIRPEHRLGFVFHAADMLGGGDI